MALVAVLVVAVIFAYPKIFKINTIEKLRSSGESISVAVMPFQNLTNDTLWNVWQSGIQNELIASLSSSPEELKVRQIESVKNLLSSKGVTNYASITPDIAGIVSRKLDANVFISGSINQAGATIRLNARLINSKTAEVFKSFQVDGNSENILHIIDSLSVMVKNALIINRLEKRMSQDYRHIISTNSPEAYRYFIYGENSFKRRIILLQLNWIHRHWQLIQTLFRQLLRFQSHIIIWNYLKRQKNGSSVSTEKRINCPCGVE